MGTVTMMPPELRDLMLRYNALGRLLPNAHEFDAAEATPAERTEIAVVLDEMAIVKAQIDAFLAKARQARLARH